MRYDFYVYSDVTMDIQSKVTGRYTYCCCRELTSYEVEMTSVFCTTRKISPSFKLTDRFRKIHFGEVKMEGFRLRPYFLSFVNVDVSTNVNKMGFITTYYTGKLALPGYLAKLLIQARVDLISYTFCTQTSRLFVPIKVFGIR